MDAAPSQTYHPGPGPAAVLCAVILRNSPMAQGEAPNHLPHLIWSTLKIKLIDNSNYEIRS